MIDLLKTMIEASKDAILPLDMGQWHCGTACCLCGDVAAYKNPKASHFVQWDSEAEDFSNLLDIKSKELFGSHYLSRSIYFQYAEGRFDNSLTSKVFTDEELEHPHLTTDHSDRAIAIDYIEMVIRKCEEKLCE